MPVRSFGAPDLFMAYHFNFFMLGGSNRVKPHPFQISLADVMFVITERLIGIAIMDLLQVIKTEGPCIFTVSYKNP